MSKLQFNECLCQCSWFQTGWVHTDYCNLYASKISPEIGWFSITLCVEVKFRGFPLRWIKNIREIWMDQFPFLLKHDLMQVMMRPMFGAFGKAGSANSIAFVSKAWTSLSLSLSNNNNNSSTTIVLIYINSFFWWLFNISLSLFLIIIQQQ